ncbi:macro domain-containing protein [Legionella micdadei]|uniref:O-acetyl-ADP-ribose deacetylase (Regulator of RNase III), contains Macro domain n=1 Tax=Legionella micdadei TaxID=451 RepID=A0A098GG94_LEGMI|nr:macro domain-containing protein [Legionella micdadei]ARG97071.1 RNase III inhibitor [Legionella micdadei]KTD26798.1 O-acetyl-ADP-ribose deacetylase [Legionella micdadei]NSL18297.1 macro domain-containing protein [Legionella micdadei]CEG61504.1 conserved protein of unknown function [Macro domain-like] [Legionella micdadei]SCY44485.1 O-acetyl-ADP-ribose deacetylase (regulator of RNase III), contains Macro domain [Legionella micdadei]
MLLQVGRCKIESILGDITEQLDMVAIVNAANARLRRGGGVAGAIHNAAGPELEKECQDLAPIKPGEAVITKAYSLPNQYVIHCLGPVYGVDKPEDVLLANCYRNALHLADSNQITSIAFPAISTGIFGYPIERATETALKTTYQIIATLRNITHIRYVLFSPNDLRIYENKLAEIFDKKAAMDD